MSWSSRSRRGVVSQVGRPALPLHRSGSRDFYWLLRGRRPARFTAVSGNPTGVKKARSPHKTVPCGSGARPDGVTLGNEFCSTVVGAVSVGTPSGPPVKGAGGQLCSGHGVRSVASCPGGASRPTRPGSPGTPGGSQLRAVVAPTPGHAVWRPWRPPDQFGQAVVSAKSRLRCSATMSDCSKATE